MDGKKIITRRNLLIGAGAAVALGAAGVTWRAYDQGVFSPGEGPAYVAWDSWRQEGADKPLDMVRAAILAANPHNTQPWLFSLAPASIDIYADTGRNIGAVDPFRKEMYIGLGCALENVVLAAEAGGFASSIKLMPDASDPTHVATIDFTPGNRSASDLYNAIQLRHTNRGPYDKRTVPDETLYSLKSLNHEPDIDVLWFSSDNERKSAGDLIIKATETFIADTRLSTDSGKWMRQDWHDIQRFKDGITLDAQGLSEFMLIAAKILPAQSQASSDDYWLQSTKDVHVGTASAFGLIVAKDNHNNVQRLNGGRLWQRMHLWAIVHGISMQPLNQALECAENEAVTGIEPTITNKLKELTGTEWMPLMMFRLGYPAMKALASPRRPAEEVLR